MTEKFLFTAFSEWINVANRKEYDFSARHIVLADDSGTLSIFVSDGNDTQIHKIKTQAASAQLIEILKTHLCPTTAFLHSKAGRIIRRLSRKRFSFRVILRL